jgi:hypothetical protein
MVDVLHHRDRPQELEYLFDLVKTCCEERLGISTDGFPSSRPPSREEFDRLVALACERCRFSEQRFWEVIELIVTEEVESFRRELEARYLALDRQRLLANLPDEKALERVQRYEAHISRQFYKALHELQRLQAARLGARPLAPLALDIDVAGGCNDELD